MSRIASETRLGTSNIEPTLRSCGASASARRRSRLITVWVPASPPELSSTSTRSPARSNVVVLQKRA
jgi:hypothetical protein